MKILVIFTGGTIGSAIIDGFITPDDDRKYLLLERYKQAHLNSDVVFDVIEPYRVLSENITADNINTLVQCVVENSKKGYDGIIVTHGTDTLQYSACALSFALGATLPVVLVSSNYELNNPLANGQSNFSAAVEFVRCGHKGVYVAYKNTDGTVYYHHANRLLRHNEASDDVYSLGGHFAVLENDKVMLNDEFEHSSSTQPLGEVTLTEHSGVLNIFCHVGDSYNYNLDGVKVVMLQPYHSGTLDTESKALADFCSRASKHSIPVFLTNVPQGKGYASAKNLDNLGIIRLPLCATIPIYMKLWIGCSMGCDIRQFATTQINEEFI